MLASCRNNMKTFYNNKVYMHGGAVNDIALLDIQYKPDSYFFPKRYLQNYFEPVGLTKKELLRFLKSGGVLIDIDNIQQKSIQNENEHTYDIYIPKLKEDRIKMAKGSSLTIAEKMFGVIKGIHCS